MDCSYCRSRLNRYLDGELGYLEVAELQRHLDFCECCAAELAELGEVRGALTAWGALELTPPAGLSQRVMAAVEREIASGTARPLRLAVDEKLQAIDDLLGRVPLPGGRTIPVKNLIGWSLAAAAMLVGIERRHVRRSRELRPSQP